MSSMPELLLALLAASAAFRDSVVAASAPAPGCASPQVLRASATSCDGNPVYSDAARLCVEGYEQAIADARLVLARSLAAVSSGDRQGTALANAKSAYAEALSSLRALVARGVALKAVIDSYKAEVVFPEDFEAVGEAGFSPQGFLDGNPCYKSTQDLLSTYSSLMASRAQELELTAKIAETLAGKALRGELGLDAEGVLPLLASGTPAPGGTGAAKASAGKAGRSQSEVTGTGRKRDELPGAKKK